MSSLDPGDAPTAEQVARTDTMLRTLRRHDDMAAGLGFAVSFFGGIGAFTLLIAMGVGDVTVAVGAPATGATTMLSYLGARTMAIAETSAYDSSGWGRRLTDRRGRRRLDRARRRWHRQVAQLDAVQGWRPREGAQHPEGRTDTHDRYRVEATARDETIRLALVRWRYDDGWTRQVAEVDAHGIRGTRDDVVTTIIVPDDDEAVADAVSRLEALAATREQRAHVAASEHDVVETVRAERRATNEQTASRINDLPSV